MQSYNFDNYVLTMEQTGKFDKTRHKLIRYEFKNPAGDVLFSGEDFGASPLHDATGIESAKALLGFLTLRKGDTDEEYFENYTPKQLEFSESFDCEQLQLYTLEDES